MQGLGTKPDCRLGISVDMQRSLPLPAGGLGERCIKVPGQSLGGGPGGGAHRSSENPGVFNSKNERKS